MKTFTCYAFDKFITIFPQSQNICSVCFKGKPQSLSMSFLFALNFPSSTIHIIFNPAFKLCYFYPI